MTMACSCRFLSFRLLNVCYNCAPCRRVASRITPPNGSITQSTPFTLPLPFFIATDFPLPAGERGPNREDIPMNALKFGDYFTSAHEYPSLTEREKMFIGLAVTLSRGCEP